MLSMPETIVHHLHLKNDKSRKVPLNVTEGDSWFLQSEPLPLILTIFSLIIAASITNSLSRFKGTEF